MVTYIFIRVSSSSNKISNFQKTDKHRTCLSLTLECLAPDNTQDGKECVWCDAISAYIALATEIDQPQPTSKTYLAYVFGYIVFLYLIGQKLCPCQHDCRWFSLLLNI